VSSEERTLLPLLRDLIRSTTAVVMVEGGDITGTAPIVVFTGSISPPLSAPELNDSFIANINS
jgi:hypothetical protein